MIMNKSINLQKAITLVNAATTTVKELCEFIFNDIHYFQEIRENFYMQELRERVANGSAPSLLDPANLTEEATDILNKIQNDTKQFSLQYALNSMDIVLDAMNQKQFKTKKGSSALLSLLCSLKELNE